MSVHSIASFSNHLTTTSRPRVTGRHSMPRLFASEQPKSKPPHKEPELTKEEKAKLERMRKQRDAGQGTVVDDPREPDGTMLQPGF